MDDLEIFAVFIPVSAQAARAFNLKENNTRLVKGIESLLSSRESTPEPQFPPEQDTHDRLVLRFTDELTNPLEGNQLGTHAQSDVHLGLHGARGVSARQCSIAVDDKLWVWLHDYRSRYGTDVDYDGKTPNEIRRGDTWILAYAPDQKCRWEKPVIQVGGLKFEVQFPNHRAASPSYVAKLRAFRERCRSTAPAFEVDLNARSMMSTAEPSQPRTPSHSCLYFDDRPLGKGGFGEVKRVVNARDGLLYAAKQCFPPVQVLEALEAEKRNKKLERKQTRKREEDPAWVTWVQSVRDEHTIMKENPHPNVMPVLDFQERSDGPVVVMPYFRKGSLQGHKNVSADHCVVVLLHLLRGLSHLHRRNVIHRDLKLENLLVGDPFKIVIADFGLSKVNENGEFTSFCGTVGMLAPEVFANAKSAPSSSYGRKADVWSAAIVVMQLYMKSFPHQPDMSTCKDIQEWNDKWCQRLRAKLQDKDENDDQVIDILLCMLQADPQNRFSADQCLEKGCQNGLFRETTDGEYVPTANSAF